MEQEIAELTKIKLQRINVIRATIVIMSIILVVLVIYQFLPLSPLTLPKGSILEVTNENKEVKAGEYLYLKGYYCKWHDIGAVYYDQLLNSHIVTLVPENYEKIIEEKKRKIEEAQREGKDVEKEEEQQEEEQPTFNDEGVVKTRSNAKIGCNPLELAIYIPESTYPDDYVWQRNIEYKYPLRYPLPITLNSESFKIVK